MVYHATKCFSLLHLLLSIHSSDSFVKTLSIHNLHSTSSSRRTRPFFSLQSNEYETTTVTTTTSSSVPTWIKEGEDILHLFPPLSRITNKNYFDGEEEEKDDSGKTTLSKTTNHKRIRPSSLQRQQPHGKVIIPKNIPNLSDIMHQHQHQHHISPSLTSPTSESITTRRKIPKLEKEPVSLPWNANANISRRTQAQIKAFTSTPSSNHHKNNHSKKTSSSHSIDELTRANKILDIILSSDARITCNGMNVVYALVSCAKIFSNDVKWDTHDVAAVYQLRVSFVQKTEVILRDILSFLISNDQLSGRQLANVAWALVRLKSNGIYLLHNNATNESNNTTTTTLRKQTNDLIDETNRELTSILECIAVQITKRTSQLKPMELCMVAWAYAKNKPRDCPAGWQYPPQEAKLITDHARSTKNEYISFQFGNDYFYHSVEEEIKACHDNNKIPHSSNTSNDKNDAMDTLFDSIADAFTAPTKHNKGSRTITSLDQCTWKELSVLAWSYAHSGHNTKNSEYLIQSITNLFRSRLESLTSIQSKASLQQQQTPLPRDISLFAWSLGILQSDNFKLSDCLVQMIHTSTDYLGTTLNISTVQRQRLRPFVKWENADLVQFANTLGRARIDHTALLISLYKEILTRINHNHNQDRIRHKDFLAWELTALLYVQARLHLTIKQDQVFEDFTNAVPRVLLQRIHFLPSPETFSCNQNMHNDNDSNAILSSSILEDIGMNSQEQANLAWSLTVLEAYKHNPTSSPDNTTNDSIKLLQLIIAAATESTYKQKKKIQIEHAHQLWQSLSLLQHDCPNAFKSCNVSQPFLQFLEENWRNEKTRTKISSARHKSLSTTLNLMGVSHFNEHDEDIDVAIVLKDDATLWTHTAEDGDNNRRTTTSSSSSSSSSNKSKVISHKVAVEFDGPAHFTRSDTNNITPRALGHTVLKYRLLKTQGWTVVRVPYYEYDKIPYWASMERQRYLQRLLKTHDSIRFSDTDISEYKVIVNNRQSRYD